MAASRKNLRIAICLLALPLAAYCLLTDWYSVDDVGITLRYARNAAQGYGIDFNPGSGWTVVQGCSTPMWFWITTFLAFFTGKVLLLKSAYFLGIVFLVLTCFGLLRILDELPIDAPGYLIWISGILTSFWFLYHHEIAYTVGMETPLWMACSVWAIIWYRSDSADEKRHGIMVMMFGGLVRFEFAILAAILFLPEFFAGWKARGGWHSFGRLFFTPIGRKIVSPLVHTVKTAAVSIPWKWGLLYSSPILAWLAFSWWYFGRALPWTLEVKLAESFALTRWEAFQQQLSMLFLDPAHRWVVPFFVIGVVKTIRRRRNSKANGALFTLLIWGCVYAFVDFYLLKAPTTYLWYRAPMHLAGVTMIGVGIHYFGAWIDRLVRRKRWITKKPLLVRAGAVTLAAYALTVLVLSFYSIYMRDYYSGGGLLPLARQAGEYLSVRAPGSRVRLSDIGIFSYFFDGYVADQVGLVMPISEARSIPVDYSIWFKLRGPEPPKRTLKRFRGRWLGDRLGYAELRVYRERKPARLQPESEPASSGSMAES